MTSRPAARTIARRLAKAVIPAPVRRRLRRMRYRVPYKIYVIRNYRLLRRAPLGAVRFLLWGRELDNFTYEIANERDLARFLEGSCGIPMNDAITYVDELQGDSQLRNAIEAKLRTHPDRNRTMPYGRRLGWYAVVRALKPRLVVETGVHDGLGSAVLLRALERNADAGVEGSLVSFDVNEGAGWLIPDWLRARHHLEIGPAPERFGQVLLDRPVDVFIHDSDHRYDHETAEFDAIATRSSPDAILITDNASSTAFPDFCRRHGLSPHFFWEVPLNHWYPGAGIGLAVQRRPAD